MTRKKLMRIQRATGLLFIFISIMVIVVAKNGTTPIDTDVTPVLFLMPLGIWWTFTKKLQFK